MVQVKLNKSNDNPFYGLRNCLKLFQSVGNTIDASLLDACWSEVKDNKEHKGTVTYLDLIRKRS